MSSSTTVEMSSAVQVFVNTFYRGKTHAIQVEAGETVADLKRKLAGKEGGLPVAFMNDQHDVRLLAANTELMDTDVIGELGLAMDTVLRLYPRVHGRSAKPKYIGKVDSNC